MGGTGVREPDSRPLAPRIKPKGRRIEETDGRVPTFGYPPFFCLFPAPDLNKSKGACVSSRKPPGGDGRKPPETPHQNRNPAAKSFYRSSLIGCCPVRSRHRYLTMGLTPSNSRSDYVSRCAFSFGMRKGARVPSTSPPLERRAKTPRTPDRNRNSAVSLVRDPLVRLLSSPVSVPASYHMAKRRRPRWYRGVCRFCPNGAQVKSGKGVNPCILKLPIPVIGRW